MWEAVQMTLWTILCLSLHYDVMLNIHRATTQTQQQQSGSSPPASYEVKSSFEYEINHVNVKMYSCTRKYHFILAMSCADDDGDDDTGEVMFVFRRLTNATIALFVKSILYRGWRQRNTML